MTQDDSLHKRKLNILHLEKTISRYTFHQENMEDITLDLWNLNVKIGDVENLKKLP